MNLLTTKITFCMILSRKRCFLLKKKKEKGKTVTTGKEWREMVEKGLTGLRKRYRVLHGNEPSTSRGSISLNLKESLFLEQRYLENISFFTKSIVTSTSLMFNSSRNR